MALAGVREIVLHDREALSLFDLSTQFFATEAQVGKNRAAVSAERVRELNPYTLVSANDRFEREGGRKRERER